MVKDRDFYKVIFTIAVPSAFQSMISYLVVVVDNIMVSSIPNGVAALAGVAQVNSITAFYTAAVGGLVGGSTVLISQYWGRKDLERITDIFSMVLKICVCAAGLVVLAAAVFPRQAVGLVISRDEAIVTEMGLTYLRYASIGWLPYAVSCSLVVMLRSIEIVKITLVITVTALFVNIGLNYILIFGHLGFPAMGVAGAGLATLVTRITEAVIVIVYAFKIQKKLPLRFANIFRGSGRLYKDYARFGLPVAFTDVQWAMVGVLKAAIIGQLGASFMAANSIVSSAGGLGMLFTGALAGGACVVVGKAVGEGDYSKARAYSNTIQIMFALIGVVIAGFVYLLRGPFVSLYGSSSDPEVYALSVNMIAILAVTLIGTNYHASCFVGINRGAGDSRFVAMVDMVCGWLVVLPATALAAFVWELPLPMIFLATRVDQLFKWVIAFFRLRGNKWIKDVTRQGAPAAQD